MLWFGRRSRKNSEPQVLDVTKDEFVAKALAAGFTQEEAERLADQSRGCLYDGHVRVGDQFLQVVVFKDLA